jgi:beta-lactamase regulating signal transducer with metallopeptidase domain
MITNNESLFAQPIFQALGWALIHFLWQGTLVALLYASFRAALQRQTSHVRYAVACCALLLMLAAPIITTLVIKRTIPSAPEPERVAAATSWEANTAAREVPMVQPEKVTWTAIAATEQPPIQQTQIVRQRLANLLPWLVSIWLGGVLLLSVRVFGGWILAQRLKNRQTMPASERWQRTVDRLATRLQVGRAVRLCESLVAEVPTVVGWLRPVILVPVSAFTGLSPQQIEALLAHELAHIRRYDYLVNLLQTAIETLLFYHPAVWWVSRQIRSERENCCDDLAVDACGNVLTYARALAALELLRSKGVVPQLAMASDGGSLLKRIQRLVEAPSSPHQRSSAWLASVVAIATIFSICVGARTAVFDSEGDVSSSRFEHSNRLLSNPYLNLFGNVALASQETTPDAPAIAPGRINESVLVVGTAPQEDQETPEDAPAPPVPPTPIAVQPAMPTPMFSIAPTPGPGFFRGGLMAPTPPAGLRTSLIAPTPRPSTPVVVGFQDEDENKPSESYIDGMNSVGYTNLSVDQLITLRDHGVSPAYIRELKAAGYPLPPLTTAIMLVDHGVRISYIKKMSDMGYQKLSFDELIQAADHGVRPEVIESLNAAGYTNLSLEQIIRTVDHGVGPSYIKTMAEIGFKSLPLPILIKMADHGVSAEYVKSIRSQGYDNLSAEQFIRLADHGVSAAFLKKAKERGFGNLSLEELIRLRDADIL